MSAEKNLPSEENQLFEVLSLNLQKWFHEFARPLPWRQDRDPYKIWISEIMLQQTTVTAVIPYYTKFMILFPSLKHLAHSPVSSVLEAWSGLGYYSRARNLHQAALHFSSLEQWPKTWKELSKAPGIGDYTSRAIASQSFDEPVGVVDGNVIRFISRLFNLDNEWWKPSIKSEFQKIADQLAIYGKSSDLNQSLMEMGATVCTPKNPQCRICPVLHNCKSFDENNIQNVPRKKPQPTKIKIYWEVLYLKNKNKIYFIKNEKIPFLKNQWILPGNFEILKDEPQKSIDFKHSITRYEIFVKVNLLKNLNLLSNSLSKHDHMKNIKEDRWFHENEIQKNSPFSIIQKIIKTAKNISDSASSPNFIK